VSIPDRPFPPAPRAGSQVFLSIRDRCELSTGQWQLIAPVQSGNEIKSASFQTKPMFRKADVPQNQL
jgi:hypothetical protein